MFDVYVGANIPMVWILARVLTSFAVPRNLQALDAGRLLVITPFDAAVTAFSARRAAWCNQCVLHAADRVVSGRLTQDGMLACLLADMQEKPIQVLRQNE
jgi:hypothetical protein